MNVKDIMTTDPAWCMPDSPLPEVARMMVERDCGQIPVVDSERSLRPVGVVTDRDIIVRTLALGKNPLDLTARDVMTSPAVTVTPDMKVEDCCQTLEMKQVRRVPVVDNDGSCTGMVSQADIAQHASKKLTAEVVRTVSQPTEARSGRATPQDRGETSRRRRNGETGNPGRRKTSDIDAKPRSSGDPRVAAEGWREHPNRRAPGDHEERAGRGGPDRMETADWRGPQKESGPDAGGRSREPWPLTDPTDPTRRSDREE